jgi:ABC-type lipopolysaccharide export system ATPase subunit
MNDCIFSTIGVVCIMMLVLQIPLEIQNQRRRDRQMTRHMLDDATVAHARYAADRLLSGGAGRDACWAGVTSGDRRTEANLRVLQRWENEQIR